MTTPDLASEPRGHQTPWPEASVQSARCGGLTVSWIPALGGKIASVAWNDREWLLGPRPGHDWSSPRINFETSEVCGWDEMFPTITGSEAHDHGEVWKRHWTHSRDRRGEIGATCSSIPARFTRAITVPDASTVRLSYRVRSLGKATVAFLWAAHPLFAVDQDDEVTVEGAPLTVTSGLSDVRHIQGAARIGELLGTGQSAKWWNPLNERSASVSLRRGADIMRMTADAPHPVHFGMWVDRSGISHADSVSLQPALGWHDDLSLAERTQTAPLLRSHASVEWSVELSFRTGPESRTEGTSQWV